MRKGREFTTHPAQMLGRADQQDRIGHSDIREIARRLQSRVKRRTRQIGRIFMSGVDGLDNLVFQRPHGHLPSGAYCALGQGCAPGPTADYPNVVQFHGPFLAAKKHQTSEKPSNTPRTHGFGRFC